MSYRGSRSARPAGYDIVFSSNPFSVLKDMDEDSRNTNEWKTVNRKTTKNIKVAKPVTHEVAEPVVVLEQTFTPEKSTTDSVVTSDTCELSESSCLSDSSTSLKRCRICCPTKFHIKKRIQVINDTIFCLDVQSRPCIVIAPKQHIKSVMRLSDTQFADMLNDIREFRKIHGIVSGLIEFSFGKWAKYKKHACLKMRMDAVEYLQKFRSLLPRMWWMRYQANVLRQKTKVLAWETHERAEYCNIPSESVDGVKRVSKKGDKPPFVYTIPIAVASIEHVQRAVAALNAAHVNVLDPNPSGVGDRFERLE
jgi:hypothetical protein